jgi:cardiolipin synthase
MALFAILMVLPACTIVHTYESPMPAVTPLGGAQRVELFIYPDDDEQALLDRIAAAKQRVLMKMYLLTDWRVVDALATAQENGVDVRAMLEREPYGGGLTAGQAPDRLKAARIPTRYTAPDFRFILTANMTKSAFAHNRELGVITTDPKDVAEVAAAFDADWGRMAFEPSSPNLVWSPVNARSRIDQVLNAAHHSLIIYAEEAQDDRQTQQLVNAVARGVQVRLLISPPISDGNPDGNAADLDQMQQGGVRVRYLKNPYIHAKMMVADGMLAFIGSENISTTSLEFNRELGILVSDPIALQRLSSTYERDWAKAVDR